MNNDNLLPNIRFHSFTNDWEQHKIKDYLFESRIPGSNGKIAKKLTVKLWGKGVVEKRETYQGSEATNYFIRKSGQFIYGKLDFLNQAFGIIPKKLDGYESTLDSPAFDIADNINSIFLLEFVLRKKFYIYQGNIANGSRKAKRIHAETFFDMPIIIPKIDEQNKIGGFFKQLEKTIILQQQLLDDHKYLKKAMLQKMFPQKGESVPRIRFAGYTSEWEIEPLSRLGKIMTGSTPSTLNKDNYSNEGIIWITPTDIKGRIVTKTSRKISEIGETGARIAPAGTILVTSIASIGKNTLLLTRAGFNQQINSLTPNKNNDSYFLFTQSEIWSEKMKKFASSGTMQIVNKTEFSSMKTSIPQLEEQEKIGNFFEQLDETIDLHEKKLETYQELKKAMLQKMFV